ncbi:dTDP-4-amino-4,6-dideoxygalactose transaminase [Vibrio alginolyticus]|uniref:dTDP-4-amino-4,6-dideoxygalactose transaminase n=1 Tax=Vibrio diabolicus TaxID=50719 RepID=A0AA92R6K4_9VIBR|nr:MULTISPECIES: dTDP-4-amino-4,6-dideoxygalactose transaminase [Vibrio]EGR0024373.1 dTDP-4-amino-4,6-dideoxygalactose transaminase [Vibrio alginolyticus]ELB2734411.1 dTDP-4-amino-4,6-dideoxygalactose transaminase [Vibrio alginolyticus]MBS9881865.1 dTDP-4-amino-4,6-dideoxygalactose transaminase [Vibrio alginolyticus]MCR9896933.1 dTDP-4-amino-4,6-dideoxygalactose transaminase [Vibrio alginolyticus]MDW2301118.1 dTDP-4-amino-4,6-dideoxygalactose transaminase [Vibrio sp. 1167]
MIEFNRKPYTGNEDQYIQEVMQKHSICGDGEFTKKCHEWFQNHLGCERSLLTPSCTHALELAALLIDVKPGDEVIMPSYTFVSTANAFVLRGAKIVFVDIRPDTMNIDETLIEQAITDKTVAIVPVHYAGVACEMDTIMAIAQKHQLFVIEDAAQGVMSSYKGRPLGTIGDIGAFSFHDTKNYTSGGEGGLLVVNNPKFVERSEILREKGTDRSKFKRGMVDKYTWIDLGSSLLPSELQAAYLWGQMEVAEKINENRLASWNRYYKLLSELSQQGKIALPSMPEGCQHNAHMFYIKVADIEERIDLINFLKQKEIISVFHYVPLHSAPAGERFSRFSGEDNFTTQESEKIIRLPLWYGMEEHKVDAVAGAIESYFACSNE